MISAPVKSVLFSRKINKPVHPPLYMNHQLINEVTNHKHFGLILSNDLPWHEHLDYNKTKAWSSINVMRKLISTLTEIHFRKYICHS